MAAVSLFWNANMAAVTSCGTLYCVHLARKYAQIFVRGHCLFREANIYQKRSSRKTVNFISSSGPKTNRSSVVKLILIAKVFGKLRIASDIFPLLVGEYSVT